MSKEKLGTSVPEGYVQGVHADYATESINTTSAVDYDKSSGTIKEKFDKIESRLTALGL